MAGNRFLVLLATLGLLLTLTGSRAAAQSAWLQIEAQPTLVKAEERARAWAALFPDVAGFRLTSGWYAIALGPYPQPEAERRLHALKAEAMIPADSYLHDGSRYRQQFWPIGAGATLPPPAPVGPEPVQPAPDDADTAAIAPTAPPDETLAEARRGEALLSRDERIELQRALHYEGLYEGALDGAYGPVSRAAFAAFQEAQGRDPTGVLTSRERGDLLAGYRAALASLGLAEVLDRRAGIALTLPRRLVSDVDYQPPFARYPAANGSGVEVMLISEAGDSTTLAGLYQVLQTLEVMPLAGARSHSDTAFSIDGRDAQRVTHAEARLNPSTGEIKGFILVWPPDDAKRRRLALATMQTSFRALPGTVLHDPIADGDLEDVDLLSGLKIRRPAVTGTGFFIDPQGQVLTAATTVAACDRITIDDDLAMQVQSRDQALGVALLAPETALAPMGFARLRPTALRPGAEIAVSGFAWEGRLGGAVITYGRLAEARGPAGEPQLQRLDLSVTPGEAGAPVLDSAGAVAGMLLTPVADARQVLPEGTSLSLSAASIAEWLSAHAAPATPATGSDDLTIEALTARARDMTVMVSCWN